MKVYLLFLLAGLLVVCYCSSDTGAYSETEKAAIDVATEWLSLVDAGEHARSWDEAAGFFKSAVSRAGWVETMASARVPLGANLSRDVKSAEFSTSLPGAPDGQYVVVRFESSFENKASAVETVTPMLDADGKWRVSGYYIK